MAACGKLHGRPVAASGHAAEHHERAGLRRSAAVEKSRWPLTGDQLMVRDRAPAISTSSGRSSRGPRVEEIRRDTATPPSRGSCVLTASADAMQRQTRAGSASRACAATVAKGRRAGAPSVRRRVGRPADMHYLMFYDAWADDYAERRMPFRAAHIAYAREGVARGRPRAGRRARELRPIGRRASVFRAARRRSPEAFAAVRSLVVNGVVGKWRVREWTTVVGARWRSHRCPIPSRLAWGRRRPPCVLRHDRLTFARQLSRQAFLQRRGGCRLRRAYAQPAVARAAAQQKPVRLAKDSVTSTT